MSSDESIWRMRVMSATMPEYVGELVRCKDCRHAYEHHDARGRWLMCEMSTLPEVKPNDFCSRGETEEDYADE